MEKKKILAGLATFAVVANLGLASVAAAATTVASGTLTAGSLSVGTSATTWSLGSAAVSMSAQTLTNTADMLFYVEDLRSAATGFTSSLAFSGAFSDGTHSVALAQVRLDINRAADGVVASAGGDDITGVTQNAIDDADGVTTGAITFMSATSVERIGKYTDDVELRLVMPAGQDDGEYTTTVTISGS